MSKINLLSNTLSYLCHKFSGKKKVKLIKTVHVEFVLFRDKAHNKQILVLFCNVSNLI